MSESLPHLLESILHECARTAPQPWYPLDYVQASGTPRDDLDPYLDRLRLAGFIELTDWVSGKGQGYRLTSEGVRLLQSPRLLRLLQDGQVPMTHRPAPAFEPRDAASVYEARRAAIEAALGDRAATPLVTHSLIAANVVVFLAGLAIAVSNGEPVNEYVAQSTPTALDLTGAVSLPHITLHHEWWRLLTCCFVHIGLIHLLVNMYFLYVVGPLLERLWGSVGYLALYLIAGLGGSCAMIWTMIGNPGPSVGAGASGALWGVLASLGTWIFLNRRVLHPELIAHWRRQLTIVIVLNLAITFAIPGISAGAHLGGGVVGLVTGLPLDWLRFGRPAWRLAGVIALLLIPAGCLKALAFELERNRPAVARAQIREERRQFHAFANDRLVPVVGAAERAYEESSPLFQQHPARRDAEKVAAAQNALAQAQTGLEELANELKRGPDYANPELRRVQEATQQILVAWIDLLAASQAYLAKGASATRAAANEVEQKKRRTEDANREWKEAYQRALKSH